MNALQYAPQYAGQNAMPPVHIPVMLTEVLAALKPSDGQRYVDCTFGTGGYSEAILKSANCQVRAMDKDPSVAPYGARLYEQYNARFTLHTGCFSTMEQHCQDWLSSGGVDGIVMDLGVSSIQLDDGARGFSFRLDGPLDMRMNAGDMPMNNQERTAADLVNTLEEEALSNIIYRYGEERHARTIARAIVHARAVDTIQTTNQLADIVRSCSRGSRPKKHTIDPATRTFQALRIALNDELGALERALEAAERLLRTGGRLVVVSFHSLEDRIVKHFLRACAQETRSRLLPGETPLAPASMHILQRSAEVPTESETQRNPRARSARLRAAIRTDAPAHTHSGVQQGNPIQEHCS